MHPANFPGHGRSNPSGKAGFIAAEMERRLTTGKYAFGEEISSSDLVEEFGSSRQPVAAALNYLNAWGYVDVLPHVGYRVVSPTNLEIADMFQGLAKIEALIVSLASRRKTKAEAELLIRIVEQNRFAGLVATAEKEQFITCVADFHQQLRYMARSKPLCEASDSWNRLSSFYLWQGLPQVLPEAAEKLNKERVEIAHAVASGRADLAKQLMEAHIMHKPYLAGVLNREDTSDSHTC